MKISLKKCPFCGGKPILDVNAMHEYATVCCVRCGATVVDKKARSAARKWNRRAGPRKMPREVAE